MTIATTQQTVTIQVQESGSSFRLDIIEQVVKGMNTFLNPFYTATASTEKENLVILIK